MEKKQTKTKAQKKKKKKKKKSKKKKALFFNGVTGDDVHFAPDHFTLKFALLSVFIDDLSFVYKDVSKSVH